MKTFYRLLNLARPFWRWMALAVLLGFFTIGSSIALMITSAWIISRAALQPSLSVLQIAIVGVRFFGISRGVSRYLERYVGHEVTFRLLAQLRVWFYEKIEPLAPARLMQYRSGDLLSRVISDIETLENFYVRVLAPPLIAVVTALVMAFFMLTFHWTLMLVLVVFMIWVGVGVPLLAWRLSRQPGAAEIQIRSDLKTSFLDGIQGMGDLLLYGRDTDYHNQIKTQSLSLNAQQQRMAMITGLHSALGVFLIGLCAAIIVVVAIPRVDPLYLAPLGLGVIATFEAFLPLSLALQHLESNLVAADRLFEIVDTAPLIHDPTVSVNLPTVYDLVVENLTFRYQEDESPILHHLNFSVEAGAKLAIVGPSGAGKSTLVNILLRFWEYEEGSVCLGGQELKGFRQEDLRNLIGVVTQSTHLFNATIRENLLLARPNATQAELDQATQQAQLYSFIQTLPEGYETWIGEQGFRLSGGERQRLAIARALLKNAPILILDEATANLDPLTERNVLQAIYTLMEGRTTLMITHRLIGLERMDKIMVLNQGQLVEYGNHQTLQEGSGLYQQMLQLQREMMAIATVG